MFRLTEKGMLDLRRQLKALNLPPFKKRQINRALIRKVASFGKKHIREQRDVDGRAFAPRKGKSRKKMLAGLSRRMKVFADAGKGKLYWSGGKVAFKHQHGHEEDWDAVKARKRDKSQQNRNDPATRQQARRLRSLGYKIRKGRRWKQPTLKWIQQNLTIGQAGLLIRVLKGSSKSRWKIKLPARAFLGVTNNEHSVLLDVLIQQIDRIR